MSYREEAYDFIDFSKRAVDSAELNNRFSHLIGTAGFDHFACVNHADFASGEKAGVMMHNYPTSWVKAYKEEQLYKGDFVYLRAGQHRLPFQWDEPWLLNSLTPSEKRVREKARSAGLNNGFTVPIMVPGDRLASCTFTSRSKFDFEALPTLHLTALFFHEGLRRLSARNKARIAPRTLTSRQRNILTYVAEGKSTDIIASLLGISRHTVDEHIETVLQKYAVGSRIQAVVRALQDGSINPLC
jgi:DNA-binding CsgD family transcriptional regulator